jgi:hypothetical protein
VRIRRIGAGTSSSPDRGTLLLRPETGRRISLGFAMKQSEFGDEDVRTPFSDMSRQTA